MRGEVSKTFIFFGEALLNLLLAILIVSILYNGFLYIKNFKAKEKFRYKFFDGMVLLMISVFSALGFAIGLLVGFSTSPVVHVVIPALLTFYGGFITYIFSTKTMQDSKQIIGVLLSALVISFFLIYGVEAGTKERQAAIQSQKRFDLYYMEQEEAIKKKYR